MTIAEIIAALEQWLEEHPEQTRLAKIKARRVIDILAGIDE